MVGLGDELVEWKEWEKILGLDCSGQYQVPFSEGGNCVGEVHLGINLV